MKKKAQSNVTTKNKPASAKDNGTKRAANTCTKEECEEKENVVKEKAIDGESSRQSLDITLKLKKIQNNPVRCGLLLCRLH